MAREAPMPRTARASAGGYCYHVLNRGNARAEVFHKSQGYEAFLDALAEAGRRVPVRLIGYCLMSNRFHLVAWPRGDGDLSRWMHWLMTAHVRRYLRHYGASGHLWQGRFKAFPIQEDEHLRTVLRYVERNALRAGLVDRAERWRWSSLAPGPHHPPLDPGPVPRGAGWVEHVNAPMSEAEVASLALAIRRDRPFGGEGWTRATAERLGLLYSIRPRGRPKRTDLEGSG
jgi:putative transposase